MEAFGEQFDLPIHVIEHIANYVDIETLINMAIMSKHFTKVLDPNLPKLNAVKLAAGILKEHKRVTREGCGLTTIKISKRPHLICEVRPGSVVFDTYKKSDFDDEKVLKQRLLNLKIDETKSDFYADPTIVFSRTFKKKSEQRWLNEQFSKKIILKFKRHKMFV